MKVLVNLLISLVALHSCSASYLKFYDRPMEICPAQNQKIVELVQECQMKIFESIQITKTKTDEILYQGYQQICRDSKLVKERGECITKLNSIIHPCITPSERELVEAISNVLVKINVQLCKIEDSLVKSTITKILAVSSIKGRDCVLENWNHILACALPTVQEILDDHDVFVTELIKGSKKQCTIGYEAKQCFHKKLSNCEIREPAELSELYFDFILNIFDCKTGNSFGLFIAIAALIILFSAAVLYVVHKRR